MSLMSKIGVVLGALLVIVCLIFVIKIQKDISDRQSSIEKSMVEMKQLGDGIVRSQAQYVSKDDLSKFADSIGLNLNDIKSDLKTFHATVEGINNTTVVTPGYHGISLGSSGTKPGDNTTPVVGSDPYGYLKNIQLFGLNEPVGNNTSVPFGQSTFSAWQAKPWGLEVYPRDYDVTTVIGVDNEGKHYTYNKFTITTGGKTYDVPVKSSKFEEVYPTASFSFNPRVYLGVSGGATVNPIPHAEMTPVLSVFLFSYGKTKDTPDLALLGLGLGYETQQSRPVVAITPVTYNVGPHIPLLKNLHIAPTITVDNKGSVGVLGGVYVGL